MLGTREQREPGAAPDGSSRHCPDCFNNSVWSPTPSAGIPRQLGDMSSVTGVTPLHQQRSVASFTFHCFALQDQRRKVCSLCGLRPSKGSTHMHIVCPMQKSPFHISHLIIDAGSGRRRVHNTTQSKSCLIISTVCLLSVSVLRPSLSDNKISIQGVQRNCLHLIICSFVGFYSCKLQKVGHF